MRVAVLSDVHSNYMALDMVLQDAARNGVHEYWFLGDAVDYGWQPVEVLQCLRHTVKPENWVLGNHDALFAGLIPTHGFGRESRLMMNQNRPLIRQAEQADPALAAFLKDRFRPHHQPPKEKRLDGMVCFLTHSGFSPTSYPYYYFDTRPLDDLVKQLFGELVAIPLSGTPDASHKGAVQPLRLLLLGHTHVPVLSYLDPETNRIRTLKVRCGKVDLAQDCRGASTIVLNPGSVGLPKDYMPCPCYVILDTHERTAEFRRLFDYAPREFVEGYVPIKNHIDKYLPFGMGRIEAVEKIWEIEDQVQRAPRPGFDGVSQDWRAFYESDTCMELGKGD